MVEPPETGLTLEFLGLRLLYLAGNLAIFLLFVWVATKIFGGNFADLAKFLKTSLKAEFTEKAGALDLAMVVVLGFFLYSERISQLGFTLLRIGDLASDPSLWNSNIRDLAMVAGMTASLFFVRSMSKHK